MQRCPDCGNEYPTREALDAHPCEEGPEVEVNEMLVEVSKNTAAALALSDAYNQNQDGDQDDADQPEPINDGTQHFSFTHEGAHYLAVVIRDERDEFSPDDFTEVTRPGEEPSQPV